MRNDSEQVEFDANEMVVLEKKALEAQKLLTFDPSKENMAKLIECVQELANCEERLLKKAISQQVAAAEHAVDSFEVGSPEWEEARTFLSEQRRP